MRDLLIELDTHQIQALARGLASGRVCPPYSALALGRVLPDHVTGLAASTLTDLAARGATPEVLAAMLDAVATDRAIRAAALIEVVASGPEAPGIPTRDTGAVVRALFSEAASEVLAVGYALYGGQTLFRPLAERMAAVPTLRVRLLLDIRREGPDTSIESLIVARFVDRFRQREWPGGRLPELFYDRRALALDRQQRASLHAKCVVVDRRQAFVSSANFTEAAQVRNVELGLLVHDAHVAGRIAEHFERLIRDQVLVQAL